MAKLLSQSNRSRIYQDLDKNGSTVIWKVPEENIASEHANEFKIASKLKIKGLRSAVEQGSYQSKEAYCYQYIEGESLRQLVDEKKLGDRVLDIAISLVGTLKELHQAGIWHQRINPSNVLVKEGSTQVALIDLTLAGSSPPREKTDFSKWKGELAFVSPEQVGKQQGTFDHRVDLYSVGIVLYEMLTGELPFDSVDDAELVHAHLVQVPESASKRVELEDPILSDITDKLLAKNPEDRYQTAFGLEWDLVAVRDKKRKNQDTSELVIGSRDQSSQLILSDNLFGREEPMSKLRNGLDMIARGPNSHFLISGPAGVGKTRLINDFEKFILEKDGLLITGSFGQFDQNLPHRGLISALKDLATVILSQPTEKHEEWKSIINEATGDIGQILVDIVPEFKWILDDRSTLTPLSGGQSQSRMNFLFQRILQEVATLNRPLVLFMDNLQWADMASWNSIFAILGDVRIKHLMFIGAYRNVNSEGEVPQEEIFRLKEMHLGVDDITLENLSKDLVQDFITDSFDTNSLEDFSRIVYEKTYGNPFFLKEFLTLLYNNGHLQFSPVLSQWVWDKKKVEAMQVSANVIQFLVQRVKKLQSHELQVLIYASCIGQHFDLQLLNRMLHGSEAELGAIISNLLNENLISSHTIDEYRFVHDQIREAAYDLGDHNQIIQNHLAIAQWLMDHPEKSREVFDIAYHFNKCSPILPVEMYFRVANINYEAGISATRTADFELALSYFRSAIDLLKESDWQDHYEFVLDLYIQATEAGLVSGSLQESEMWLQTTLDHARSTSDRVRAYEIKLNHLSETHQFGETVKQLLIVLDEIGYGIKRNPSQITVLRELLAVKWLLRNKKISDIENLPEMKDENALAFMRLTVNATVSIFGHAPDILPVVFIRLTRLSLKYGNSVYAPFGYITYGFAISVFMNDIKNGYAFGKMAVGLVDKLNAQIVRTKVMVSFYGFLCYWKESLQSSAAPLRQAYINGRETGDLLYASFAASFHGAVRLYCGENLAMLLESLTEDLLTIKQLNQELVYQIQAVQRQYVINLITPKEDPLIFDSDGFDEEVFFKKLEEIDDLATAFRIYNYKLGIGCIFNDYETAYENAIKADNWEDETESRQIGYPSFLMFKTMAELKLLKKGKRNGARKLRKSVRKKIRRLKSCADLAPQNYSNKVNFLRALVYENEGKIPEAIRHYNQAIEESQNSGFIHEEALIREHFAYLYFEQKDLEHAEMMLVKAFNCYQSWGALAKCDQLIRNYPDMLGSMKDLGREKSISSFQNVFDLNTIISANQTLSSENSLEGLLGKFLKILIDNASTTKIVIIIKDKGGKMVAKAISNEHEFRILSEKDREIVFPESVINYVVRSKTDLVSKNFTEETKYRFDPYVQLHLPKSVCCLPILSKNELMGAVYIENNLTEDAFDLRRVEFYKTICTQLAISLDNVLLYSELEEKVKERTELLSQEKKKSDDLLLNILPEDTAVELKEYGKTSAKRYNNVTVLFCDIKNFTQYAEKLSPEELVNQLDHCFREFDRICQQLGLEKIKTVGDAYIAAGGVPENNLATAENVATAALHMQEFVQQMIKERKGANKDFFSVRIGIHTGPVVAGVVGSKKFQFDIWGDTVNIAARMEQVCEEGKINISLATYEMIRESFDCTPRGKIQSKNKGEMEMYYLDGKRLAVKSTT